jgi:hypothetical protein
MESMLEGIRETYNVPNETPREQMWTEIVARLDTKQTEVLDLSAARRRRAFGSSRTAGWAVAAAAVLVLGVGIGRMTAPTVLSGPAAITLGESSSLTPVEWEHLDRTESLLTMVRTDARAGRIDPATGAWASGLLSQTRLLLDSRDDGQPDMSDLLLDLELLLIQIVGVAETGSMDEARARTELELALRSLEEGEVLSRIQAALPSVQAGA